MARHCHNKHEREPAYLKADATPRIPWSPHWKKDVTDPDPVWVDVDPSDCSIPSSQILSQDNESLNSQSQPVDTEVQLIND